MLQSIFRGGGSQNEIVKQVLVEVTKARIIRFQPIIFKKFSEWKCMEQKHPQVRQCLILSFLDDLF